MTYVRMSVGHPCRFARMKERFAGLAPAATMCARAGRKTANCKTANWRLMTKCASLYPMNAHINQELQSLSIAEKRSLGEALIASAESEASAPLITEAQRLELRSRLAHHRANPDETGVEFSQLKANLINSRNKA